MNHLLTAAFLAVLCGTSSGATAPGVWGNSVLTNANEANTADAAWRHVAALIEHVPPYHMAPPFPGKNEGLQGYFLWQEFSNQLLRRTGLDFYRRFPDDPRIWTWYAATLSRGPRYWDIAKAWRVQENTETVLVFDKAAQDEWTIVAAEIAERAIQDTAAPEELRIKVWSARIGDVLTRYASAVRKGSQTSMPDFDGLGEDLMTLGATFPEAKYSQIRSATSSLMRMAERFAPQKASSLLARLGTSVNRTIAELAAGRSAIEEAKVTPMEMRFTAIDGRHVDLRELRGKVVLIDYRGVTWCMACRGEEPYMRDAYAKYREHGFEIITITYETKESSRDFVLRHTLEHGLVWPHYFDGKGAQNPYIKRFGITAVPQHFLLDQKGLLVSTDVRGKKLEHEVRRLLGIE